MRALADLQLLGTYNCTSELVNGQLKLCRFLPKNIISYGNKCAVTCVAYFYEHSIAAYPFAFFTYRRVQNLSNRQFPNFHWLDRNKMEKEFHLESKELLTKCVTPSVNGYLSIAIASCSKDVCVKIGGGKQEEKCHSLDKLCII